MRPMGPGLPWPSPHEGARLRVPAGVCAASALFMGECGRWWARCTARRATFMSELRRFSAWGRGNACGAGRSAFEGEDSGLHRVERLLCG